MIPKNRNIAQIHDLGKFMLRIKQVNSSKAI
jgi:hypothetical protein